MFRKGWIVIHRTNAEGGASPLWPFKLPYYLLERGEDYDYTVIGKANFDYPWIMSRKPFLEDIKGRMAARGKGINGIISLVQSWED